MTSSLFELFASGTVLVLLQALAALPWLYLLDPVAFGALARRVEVIATFVIAVLVGGAVLGTVMGYNSDPTAMEFYGWLYGLVLHLQLAVDSVIAVLGVLLLFWPRGGTVAWATFREGYRQPMFWLLLAAVVLLMFFSAIIPYFTFGDDYKMMKQLGFDMIMLSTMLFCVLLASMSVSEEIEGRTAVTLMSKPVTRRQFLLGKFFGILLAGWFMTCLMAAAFIVALAVQVKWGERLANETSDAMTAQVQSALTPAFQALTPGPTGKAFAHGVALWDGEAVTNLLGQLMGFGQVMVMLAIAASLAWSSSYSVTCRASSSRRPSSSRAGHWRWSASWPACLTSYCRH
jgi:hypothetical protein